RAVPDDIDAICADINLVSGDRYLRGAGGAARLIELDANQLPLDRVIGDHNGLQLIAGQIHEEMDSDRAGYNLVVDDAQAPHRMHEDALGDAASVQHAV